MKQTIKPNFSDILKEAVSKPGKMLEAYRAFHEYSMGNMLLAWSQCEAREIPLGPMATFKSWQSKGRNVKKGAKAIALCVPTSFKKEVENRETGEMEERTHAFFTFKNSWFVLDQTEGPDVETTLNQTDFNIDKALETLKIERVPFKLANGNVQGYAMHGTRQIAVNPLAQLPLKTTIHEVAHIELGHTDQTNHDDFSMPRDLKEVEAESVALLVLSCLGLPGVEYCRGYIQNWIKTDEIPEKNAKRIMATADRILKAGLA